MVVGGISAAAIRACKVEVHCPSKSDVQCPTDRGGMFWIGDTKLISITL
jgi:hypothetical protein